MTRLVCALIAFTAGVTFASPASAAVERHRLRYGPVTIGGYSTVYPGGAIDPPPVHGYITGMHARLVDGKGRPVTIRDVMLHHIFFHRKRPKPVELPCAGKRLEAFYGTGEEDQRLRLPDGYGYRLRSGDEWRMRAMLMSHSVRPRRIYIEYTVDVETSRQLTPVQPFWVRANGCEQESGYHLRGDGAPGSTHEATAEWTAPYDLRIVAAGGHLHGGARDMWLSQPGCGDRRLLDNRPAYAPEDHLFYRARPILHEPGPIDTRYFLSRTGVTVRAGERLVLHGLYEADVPRSVMAIMHVYVARDRALPATCPALPADATHLTRPGLTRPDPPRVHIPLNGLDAQGRTFAFEDPPWPVVALGADPEVEVGDAGFAPRRFTLPGPTTVTWRFTGDATHNVQLASGPRLISTPIRRPGQRETTPLAVPGRYRLFCMQHPVTMHAVVDVLGP